MFRRRRRHVVNLSHCQPPPPGQKRKREDWELIWYIGMYGTMAFIALGLYFKPDTRCVRMLSTRVM